MCARRAGLSGPTLTLQALIDFTLSSFAECSLSLSPAVTTLVSQAIERFLRQQISYDELTQAVAPLTGATQPLDGLRAILDVGPDPLPAPAGGDSAPARRPSRPWSRYEDQRLLAGIYRHGIENWTAISKFVGNGRTRSQCSQRWYRGLNPKIRKDQWSPDEDQRLLALVAEHGEKSWTNVAALLGNRSDVQCRYRYRQLGRAGDRADAPAPLRPCAFFRPAIFALPPGPIRVPLLQEKRAERVRVGFQIPGGPPMVLPFTVPLAAPTPGSFAPQQQHQSGGQENGDHRISAPDFDGKLYSVC
jgi:hypothetical protein